jgi:hypothetical protein
MALENLFNNFGNVNESQESQPVEQTQSNPISSFFDSTLKDNTAIVDPRQISNDYTDEDMAAYGSTVGGVDAYSKLLFPNQQQDILKGNYQGSVVGNVPIFTAKDIVSPLPFMAYRRDQLRAAAYKKMQEQLKPANYEFPFTKIPMYGDKLRESFTNGIKYFDEIATQISRTSGVDGWKVLESGKGEYGIMYRNFLASTKGLVDGFDYLGSYALKQKELADKGFYVGINSAKTIEDIFAAADDVENFVYNRDIGELIRTAGAELNFNSVLYDAIKNSEATAWQTFKSDPANSNADFSVWQKQYWEGRTDADMIGIANNVIRQNPAIAKSQGIDEKTVVGWIRDYTGTKDIQSADISTVPRNQILQAPATEDISPYTTDMWLSFDNLNKGDRVAGTQGRWMEKDGGVVRLFDGKEVKEISAGNMTELASFMLEMKGYDAKTKAQIMTNLTSQQQSGTAFSFNSFQENNEAKSEELSGIYKSNEGNSVSMFKAVKAADNSSYYLPNSTMTKIQDANEATSKKGISRSITVTYGDKKDIKGAIMPASLLATVTASPDGSIVQKDGTKLAYYKDGDNIIIPEVNYFKAEGKPYYEIYDKNNEPIRNSKNETVKIPIKEVDAYLTSPVKNKIETYKTNNQLQSGVYGIDKNVVGKEEFATNVQDVPSSKYQYTRKLPAPGDTGKGLSVQYTEETMREAVGAWSYILENKDTNPQLKAYYDGYDFTKLTKAQKQEIVVDFLRMNGGNPSLVKYTGSDKAGIEKLYKDIFF